MVRTSGGAQIFTLAHEMAHIWAGQGGLSNPDYGLRSEWEDSTVEQFCNRVAAETLVPGEDFRSRWSPDLPSLSDHLSLDFPDRTEFPEHEALWDGANYKTAY